MTIQLSTTARNARLDAIETVILAAGGTGCTLRIYSGAMPADCATAVAGGNTGSANICTITLPASDFMAAASGGSSSCGPEVRPAADGVAIAVSAAESEGLTLHAAASASSDRDANVRPGIITVSDRPGQNQPRTGLNAKHHDAAFKEWLQFGNDCNRPCGERRSISELRLARPHQAFLRDRRHQLPVFGKDLAPVEATGAGRRW